MDADGDNVYEVVIRALDKGDAVGEKAVRIYGRERERDGNLDPFAGPA